MPRLFREIQEGDQAVSMRPRLFHSKKQRKIDQEAASWTVKRDSGLTAEEQMAFEAWLSVDPAHPEALQRNENFWNLVNRSPLPQSTESFERDVNDLANRSAFKRWTWLASGSAAAALLIFVSWTAWFGAGFQTDAVFEHTFTAAEYQNRILKDGSIIEFNKGTRVRTRLTSRERTVWLTEGEAHFYVAKDPSVPFVVHAGEAEVRALGTAFNVRLTDQAVDVLVTEGKVRFVKTEDADSRFQEPDRKNESLELTANQATTFSRQNGQTPSKVFTINAEEMAEMLVWKPENLVFTETPLGDVIVAFNKRNDIQLVLKDPELNDLTVEASFRSDNVETFARLLEMTFGIQAQRRGEKEILLSKAD